MTPQTDGAAAPPQEEEDVWARIARRRRELGMAGPAASPPVGERETQTPSPSPPASPASPGERWTPPRYQPEQRLTPQRETQTPAPSPDAGDDDGVFKRLEAKRRLLDAVEVPEQRQATDPRFEPMQLDETAEGEREQYVQGRVLDRLAAAAIANGQVPKPPTRWADGRRIPDRENHMRVAREHILQTGDPATLEEMQERARREWTDDYAGRQAIDRLEASVRDRIMESAPPGADVDDQAKRMLASMLGVEEPEELEEFRRKGITAIPREVGAGVGRSFARMSAELPAWAVGLVETARERLTGEAAKPGASVNQSFLRRQEQMIGQYGLSQLANEALPASFTAEGVGKFYDPLWWSAVAGEQVPIFASLFTGAAAGAKIAGMAGAGARGVEATRQLASLGSIGSLYASGTYHEGKQLLMEQGMSEEEASLRASIGSAIGGVTAAIFARLPYGEFIARSPAASGRIANAVRGAIVEGTSEALQEASQLLALYGMDAKDPESADLMRVLEAAVAATGIGAVFGASRRPTQSPSQQLASEIDQQASDVATASDLDPEVRAELARETPEQLATTLIGEREALRNLEEAGPRPGREERFETERQRLRERVEMIEGVYRERTGQEPPAGDVQPTTVEPVDDPFATLPDDATAARPTTPETVPADPARPADRVVAEPPALFDPEARAAEPEAVVEPPPQTAERRVPQPETEPTPARVEQPPTTRQPDPVAETVPRGTEPDAPQQLRQRFRETSPEHARLDTALEGMVERKTLTSESADVIREAMSGVEASRMEGVDWGDDARLKRPGRVRLGGKRHARTLRLRRGMAALQQRARDGDARLSEGERQFWSSPDVEGATAFLHEFGHVAQTTLDAADRATIEQVYQSKSRKEWAGFFTKGMSADAEARVAEYFASNPQEFFVQSFAEWVLTNRVSDARLRPFFRRVGDAMARALSRVRGRGHLSELEPIYAKITDGGRTTPVELTDIATLQERTDGRKAQRPRVDQKERPRQEKALRQDQDVRPQAEARAEAEVLKREPVRGVEGREASLELPDGRTLPVRYTVVEAADLAPSHDPTQGFKPVEGADPNERRYEDPTEGAESRKTVERIGKAPKPDLLLTDTPTATDGPPIVSPSGVVMGGNARSMGMILAHARGNAGDYVQALRKRAQALGLDAGAIEGMERPVLVRVVPQEHVGKPGELSRILNEPLTTTRSEITDAVSRGRKITPDAAARVAEIVGEDSLRAALGAPAKAAKIVRALRGSDAFSDAELSRFVRGGEITDAGKIAIEQALLGAALGDVRTMAEMPPSVERALIGALPSVVKLNRPAERGGDPTFAPSLGLAVEGFADYRRSGLSMKDYADQSTLTPRPWLDDPRAVALIRALDSDSPTRLRKRLSDMARAVEDAQSGQATFLGETPTVEGAFRDSFREYGAPPPPRGPTIRRRLSRGKALEYVRRTSADPDALDAEATRQIIEMQDSDFELRRIPISAIDRIMGESRINADKAAKYARELGQSEAPPILAGLVNGELTVIDGKHRWAAAREAGMSEIDAFVPIRHSVDGLGQAREYGMPTSPDESTIQQLRRRINRMKKALEGAREGKAESRRRVGERLARAEAELAELEYPKREAAEKAAYLAANQADIAEGFEKTVEALGVTDAHAKTGYILPDGRMLDMSNGERSREVDHREVGEHIGYPNDSGGMEEFMLRGAARVDFTGGVATVNVSQPMTTAQVDQIIASGFSKAIIEVDGINGMSIHHEFVDDVRQFRAALARANRVARGLEPGRRTLGGPPAEVRAPEGRTIDETGETLFGPLPPMPSPRSKAMRLARGSTEILGASRNYLSEETLRAISLQAGEWGRKTLLPKVERVLDAQKDMYGKLSDVRMAALREIRGKPAASWSLQEVDYGDRDYGVARIVDAVEGRIPLEQLSADERGFVEKYREVVAETGKLLEDAKFLQWIPGEGGEPGRLEPFRRTPGGKVFLRSATAALRDLYLNPSGPAWNAYVEAIAEMNDMKPAEARERALKMARNPFARIGPELTRAFPEHPTSIIVEMGGIRRRIPLLHTDPFAAVESMVRDTVMRAGFAGEFGQSWRGVPGKEAEGLWEVEGEGMMTQLEMDRSQFELAGGDPKAFDQLVRALSGLQTHEPLARPGTAAHEVMEVVSTAASVARSFMLTRTAVVQIPEWLGNIRSFGGTGRAIRALKDVVKPTRSIIEGLETSGLVEPGAIPETGREMIDLMERMGAVSFDMARFTIDRDRAFQSFARVFGNNVMRMFGANVAWTWQERHGAMTGLRMAVDMKNGKGHVFDFLTLRGFGFERADALRLMRGEGTNAEYLTFVRRFATRSNSTRLTLPAEESRAINNRHWRNWFWFTRYPTMKARTMYRTIATMAEAVNEARKNPTAENRKVAGASIVRLADSLAGTAASGAVAHLLLAFLMGGKAGLGVALDDWREDPVEMAAKSFTYSMFGPIITSMLRVGADKRIDQFWRASAGASVLADLVSAAAPEGLGEYQGMSPVERYAKFAKRYTPVSRPIGTMAATLGLGSKDAELETAISAYWRQTGREEEGESRRFRGEMRRAADLMRTGNPMDEDQQAKIRARIAAALDVKESELEGDTREARRRVAQSLRSRRLLTRMNEEQRKAFNDRHGDAIFNRIKAHDELLEEWAKAISRGADAPRGGAGTR